jgi:hypothetical protein
MYQDFGGASSPGGLVLVISQKTVVFFRQVFFLEKTVKMLLYKRRISELVDGFETILGTEKLH